jgi:hypothetical protein
MNAARNSLYVSYEEGGESSAVPLKVRALGFAGTKAAAFPKAKVVLNPPQNELRYTRAKPVGLLRSKLLRHAVQKIRPSFALYFLI